MYRAPSFWGSLSFHPADGKIKINKMIREPGSVIGLIPHSFEVTVENSVIVLSCRCVQIQGATRPALPQLLDNISLKVKPKKRNLLVLHLCQPWPITLFYVTTTVSVKSLDPFCHSSRWESVSKLGLVHYLLSYWWSHCRYLWCALIIHVVRTVKGI